MGCLQPLLREAGGAGAGGAVRAAPAGRHQPHPAHQILPRAAPRDTPALRPPALPRSVEDRSLVRGEEAPGRRGVGGGGEDQVFSGVVEQNPRMVWLKGSCRGHLVQPPCHGQGHFPSDQAAQSSIQPGLGGDKGTRQSGVFTECFGLEGALKPTSFQPLALVRSPSTSWLS